MGVALPTLSGSIAGLVTSSSMPGRMAIDCHMRAPTDPFFYADVFVKNMVVGSSWMLGYYDSGTFTELDSGTCTVTDFTISGVPSYASPFLMELRVRKASAATKYFPIKVYGYHSASGVTMYVSQVEDEIA